MKGRSHIRNANKQKNYTGNAKPTSSEKSKFKATERKSCHEAMMSMPARKRVKAQREGWLVLSKGKNTQNAFKHMWSAWHAILGHSRE